MTIEEKKQRKQQVANLLVLALTFVSNAESLSKKMGLSVDEEIKSLKDALNQEIERLKDLVVE